MRIGTSFFALFFLYPFYSSIYCQETVDSIQIQLTDSILDTNLIGKYLDRAELYSDSAQYIKAIDYSKKGLALAEEYLNESDSINIHIINLIAQDYISIGNVDSSKFYAAKAISLSKIRSDNFQFSQSTSYNTLGIAAYHEGKYEKSINFFENSVNVLKQINDNSSKMAGLYNNLCILTHRVGDYEKAKNYGNRALEIKTELLGNDHQEVGEVYLTLGALYNSMKNYSKALFCYKKMTKIFESVFNYDHPYLGSAYQHLGAIYTQTGDIDKGYEYYKRSLKIQIKTRGENHINVAKTYHVIGNYFMIIDDFEKANEYHEKALEIRTSILEKSHPDISRSMIAIADIQVESELFDKAIFNYNRALIIKENSLKRESPDFAEIFDKIGSCYKYSGHFEEAQIFYQKSLDHRLKYNKNIVPLLCISYLNLAELNQELNNLELAFEFYWLACELFNCEENTDNYDHIEDYNTFQRLLNTKVKLLEKRHEESNNKAILDSLKICYDNIISFDEFMIQKYPRELSRKLYYDKMKDVYEGAINNLTLLGKPEHLSTAFIYSEKTKSRSLLERLTLIPYENSFNLPDSISKKEIDIDTELSFYNKTLFELQDNIDSSKDSIIAVFENRLFELNRLKEKNVSKIQHEYPNYYNLRYSKETIGDSKMRDGLLKDNQVLLEYFKGENSIFAFVLSKDTFHVEKIELDFPLRKWVKEFRKHISQPFSFNVTDSLSTDQHLESYAEIGYKLYEKLLQPLVDFIPEQSELIIAPDGELGYIPFDALITKKNVEDKKIKDFPFLIKKYQTSITYSGSLLQEMRRKEHMNKPKKHFLGIAPKFDGNDSDTLLLASRSIDYSRPRNRLAPLLENIPEVLSIQKLIGGDVMIDTSATESAFVEKAKDYQILHLSTHGKANDQVGDYSFLAFQEIRDSLENEWLYNRELYDLELNADMVVLSACETGIGELQKGEGIISLARGFSYAGAKSIITSLWSVNDKQTPIIMQSFYKHLKAGETKDGALRHAKLEYLQNSPNPEPFFWASFIAIGDMSPIEFGGFNYNYLIGAFVLLMLGFLYFKK